MTQPKTSRIPAPIYAAAGAGALAYQQLRKLPAAVTNLTGRATLSRSELRERAAASTIEFREKAAATTVELRGKAAATLRNANTTAVSLRDRAANGRLDADRLREAAIRNAAVVVTGAQAAQERALALYGALVARGERVVGSGVVQAADTVNADMEATEAPAAVTATPADDAEPVEPVEPVEPAAAKRKPGKGKSTRPATKASRTAAPSGTAPTSGAAAGRTRPASGE